MEARTRRFRAFDQAMTIQQGIQLAAYTSWLVGGPAEFFCSPNTLEELQQALAYAQSERLMVTVIGGGSNVLISDKGILGLTICLKNFSGTEIGEDAGRLVIKAWSGTSKSELLRVFLKYKLAPALFLAGLPGDVGGGIVMNAGVAEAFRPREFVELVDWIEVMRMSGDIQRIDGKVLNWQYRHCSGWQPGVITQVQMSWPLEPDTTILDQVKIANKLRLSKQPLDMPSCGSVFVNPVGHKAAQLIDSVGLKGFSIGGAEVSRKHANFIVNKGNAKACEIWQLIDHVKATVLEKTGVQLVTEVILMGQW